MPDKSAAPYLIGENHIMKRAIDAFVASHRADSPVRAGRSLAPAFESSRATPRAGICVVYHSSCEPLPCVLR